PKILGIFCNWCSYSGADYAGTARMKIAPNLRIIRVMCSGRVEPGHVLEAFRTGADGVLVAGCHPGDCHYMTGNYRAARRLPLLRQMLQQLGIEPERLRLEWISASEGKELVRVAEEMTEQLRALGPLKLQLSLAELDMGEPKAEDMECCGCGHGRGQHIASGAQEVECV
ncbi:MAG: hydrogenase iron-sulfur subunit, partial [Deltaproteobacteria bacterium]|nr:hydrogenase iron-sulfur subunit [Deltaproteobacteria bacterium]